MASISACPQEAAVFSLFSSGVHSLWTDAKGALGRGPGDRKSPQHAWKLALRSLRHAWRAGRTAYRKSLPEKQGVNEERASPKGGRSRDKLDPKTKP